MLLLTFSGGRSLREEICFQPQLLLHACVPDRYLHALPSSLNASFTSASLYSVSSIPFIYSIFNKKALKDTFLTFLTL